MPLAYHNLTLDAPPPLTVLPEMLDLSVFPSSKASVLPTVSVLLLIYTPAAFVTVADERWLPVILASFLRIMAAFVYIPPPVEDAVLFCMVPPSIRRLRVLSGSPVDDVDIYIPPPFFALHPFTVQPIISAEPASLLLKAIAPPFCSATQPSKVQFLISLEYELLRIAPPFPLLFAFVPVVVQFMK